MVYIHGTAGKGVGHGDGLYESLGGVKEGGRVEGKKRKDVDLFEERARWDRREEDGSF